MDIYIKKIVELSEEEKNILRAAASIMDWLAEETDEGDFFSCQRRYYVCGRKFSVHNRDS